MNRKSILIFLAILVVSAAISITALFGFAKLIKYFWEYL
jgi:hypothetical protein